MWDRSACGVEESGGDCCVGRHWGRGLAYVFPDVALVGNTNVE